MKKLTRNRYKSTNEMEDAATQGRKLKLPFFKHHTTKSTYIPELNGSQPK